MESIVSWRMHLERRNHMTESLRERSIGRSLLQGLAMGLILLTSAAADDGEPVTGSLTFSALIDGSDYLHIQGNSLWYVHRNWDRPGQWQGRNEPTYVNGNIWYPSWNGNVSEPYVFSPPLPGKGIANVSLYLARSRYQTILEQAPDEDNSYEAVILLNDDPPSGAVWYEFVLTWEYRPITTIRFSIPEDTTNMLVVAGSTNEVECLVQMEDGTPVTDGTVAWSVAPASLGAFTADNVSLNSAGRAATLFVASKTGGSGIITATGTGLRDDAGISLPSVTTTMPVTVVGVSIAMDGNRDGVIDFDDEKDKKCLFWVNDDRDVERYNERMWQEDDSDDRDVPRNCDDSWIGNSRRRGIRGCKRDLEDFARVHVRVDPRLSALSGVAYQFEMVSRGTNPVPLVNLFEAVNARMDYLSVTNIADEQILKEKLLTVGADILDAHYVDPTGDVSPFLLEGCQPGEGDLTFRVLRDGVEIASDRVTVDIRPIEEFYDYYRVKARGARWRAEVETIARPVHVMKAYTPGTGEYFLYVHGWNMEEGEKQRWAETVFKRLWWQGYQGRMGLFSWPCLVWGGSLAYRLAVDSRNFDNSEFLAWRSSDALSRLLRDLNDDGQLRVLAHSQGNVVFGEALRKYSGPPIRTYIGTQAAMSAHYYDAGVTNAVNQDIPGWPWDAPITTPNIIAHFPTGDARSGPCWEHESGKTITMANYFNLDDFALKSPSWELNNVLKPDGLTPYLYAYHGRTAVYEEGRDRFTRGPRERRTVLSLGNEVEKYQIFSYCAESRVKALGQVRNGAFAQNRNLADGSSGMQYDDQHYCHSRQFRSNIVAERAYWRRVTGDCGFVLSMPEQEEP
jgi:hypothetical protein